MVGLEFVLLEIHITKELVNYEPRNQSVDEPSRIMELRPTPIQLVTRSREVQGLFRHRARVPVAFVGSTKEWGKEAGRQEAKRLVVIEIQQVVYGKVN